VSSVISLLPEIEDFPLLCTFFVSHKGSVEILDPGDLGEKEITICQDFLQGNLFFIPFVSLAADA